jgi:formylglycine-generating enzyme required for sulfatase activity
MGSTHGGPVELPVHTVHITRPFWIGKYEVTQTEYQALMNSNPSYFKGANLPVETVSWDDAMAYCAALTVRERAAGRVPAGYQYRLPTEAEWEYCCRAGTTTEFNVGNTLSCPQVNFNPFPSPSCIGQTTPIGSYAANPWGLYDTHGNVWEWCLDWWDGSANYSAGPVADPYVASGLYRVFRGGGWLYLGSGCRSAFRAGYYQYFRCGDMGLRVVLAPVLVR